MTTVTEEMRNAGSEIASNIINATVAKNMNGLGGSCTWGDWLDKYGDVPNLDLILDYVETRIDSVTAIYLAMERAK